MCRVRVVDTQALAGQVVLGHRERAGARGKRDGPLLCSPLPSTPPSHTRGSSETSPSLHHARHDSLSGRRTSVTRKLTALAWLVQTHTRARYTLPLVGRSTRHLVIRPAPPAPSSAASAPGPGTSGDTCGCGAGGCRASAGRFRQGEAGGDGRGDSLGAVVEERHGRLGSPTLVAKEDAPAQTRSRLVSAR